MELKELKEKLYKKLVAASDINEEEMSFKDFDEETNEDNSGINVFLEIVNEAVAASHEENRAMQKTSEH